MLGILILIFVSLLQSSFLSFDVILLVLIARTFITPGKTNLFLAFGFGLLISYLVGAPIGVYSVIYLILVTLASIARSRLLSSRFLIIIPLFALLLFTAAILKMGFLNASLNLSGVILQSTLSFPIFLAVKFWEEHFTIQIGVRLKI